MSRAVTITRSVHEGRSGWLVRWRTPRTKTRFLVHRHWCATQADAIGFREALENLRPEYQFDYSQAKPNRFADK